MAEVAPSPFTIHVPDEVLEDLRLRLQRARLVPDNVGAGLRDPNGAWSYGTDKVTLEEYVSHWLNKFDWRQQEKKLNSFPHFTLPVNGLKTHFIHQPSTDPNAIPLLLVHGWPGSIVEFLKLLPLLKRFHVVAPSIPGYGWSEAPREPGASVVFMAEHFAELMRLLGYRHYCAQGGDWGAVITSQLAARHPESCVALHVNMCVAVPSTLPDMLKAIFTIPFWTKAEWDGLKSTYYFHKYESAYQKIQGTKPQSLGYGLNDSPVGLLAWILEKFQTWSDNHGGRPEDSGLTMDEILSDVMVYWTTQSITSSCRLYYETLGLHPPQPGIRSFSPNKAMGTYVAVPTGVIWSPAEIIKVPRKVAELCFNIKHWSTPSRGGHFFAFEQPELMAEDLNRFFFEVIHFPDCVSEATSSTARGRGWWLLLGLAAGGGLLALRSRL